MKSSKFMTAVASAALALALGAGVTGATMADHGSSAHQVGVNKNQTSQDAKTKSETDQANINSPISSHSKSKDGHDAKDGRKGSTDQKNDASTTSKSKNDNDTTQSVDQHQSVKSFHFDNRGHKGQDGQDCRCDSFKDDGSNSATQKGSNDNSTEQHAKSSASTIQANLNTGNGKGDVDQSNKADTSAKSSNHNSTDQSVHQKQDASDGSKHGKSSHGEAFQEGSNTNSTKQDASSHASTEQVNIYAPITVFGFGSDGGDVHQSNDANTKAESSNSNDTTQSVDQSQKGSGNAKQVGSNSNSTEQSASSSAKTQQANIYAPISVFSHGSGNGSVSQGNSASTHGSSTNSNDTGQDAGQAQGAAHSNG